MNFELIREPIFVNRAPTWRHYGKAGMVAGCYAVGIAFGHQRSLWLPLVCLTFDAEDARGPDGWALHDVRVRCWLSCQTGRLLWQLAGSQLH